LKIAKGLKILAGGAMLLIVTGCASAGQESTKEQSYEPYTKTQTDPDGYDDPCFDRKKARKMPGCLAYDPDA